jgi:ribosome maturation factor RimP
MIVKPAEDAVLDAILPVVEGLGFELVEVQVARAGRRRIVRVLADRPRGGIALADCARISRALSPALETTELASGPYTLEVSSPGLDRRLEAARDFRRYVGESVTLHLSDGRQAVGVLASADDVHLKLDGGEPIPYAQVKYGTRNY